LAVGRTDVRFEALSEGAVAVAVGGQSGERGEGRRGVQRSVRSRLGRAVQVDLCEAYFEDGGVRTEETPGRGDIDHVAKRRTALRPNGQRFTRTRTGPATITRGDRATVPPWGSGRPSLTPPLGGSCRGPDDTRCGRPTAAPPWPCWRCLAARS